MQERPGPEPGEGELLVDVEAADAGSVRAVFDRVGASTFDAGLACLARSGMLVPFGACSGPAPALDPLTMMRSGSLFLTRPTLGDQVAGRDELLLRGGAVLGAVRGHEELEARRTTGKSVLLP